VLLELVVLQVVVAPVDVELSPVETDVFEFRGVDVLLLLSEAVLIEVELPSEMLVELELPVVEVEVEEFVPVLTVGSVLVLDRVKDDEEEEVGGRVTEEVELMTGDVVDVGEVVLVLA
jgi:hypothetical protein